MRACCAGWGAEEVPEEVVGEEVSEIAEDIFQSRKVGSGRTTGLKSGMSIAVIKSALFRIAEHGVGFSDFFKAFLSFLIARIAVGMVLKSQLPVSRFDFF